MRTKGKEKRHICADCGTFTDNPLDTCEGCDGKRIGLTSQVKQLLNVLGEGWWEGSFGSVINDTMRLDWLLLYNPEKDCDSHGNHWMRWFRESYHYIVRGSSYRECIDRALVGDIEQVV